MKNILFIIPLIIAALLPGCSSGNNHIHETVDEHPESAAHVHEHSNDSSGYSIITLTRQPFAFSLKTGGMIMADNKDILLITAKSPGLVKFSNAYLFPGVKVSRGQNLFTISGEQLTEDNSELRYRQLKADLDRASQNYERAKNLISDKIITEEHFLTVKNEYEKALNEFENLNATYSEKGNSVSSPGNGYIREIFAEEGQKVSSGEALASIIIERNLILKADVSPDNLDILPRIESANFRVGYSKKLYKTSEMNGRKIAFGKSTGGNSFYVPVYFSIDYDPGLIEGSFAEVFLTGETTENLIVVPNSALMEEFGKLYVFVAHEDGDFVKRYITTGYSDGENTVVPDGLSENEKIVSEGAYLIKLSQMTTAAPAHNH
ncbi:MAG: efflux RND transporter periplasmic adaptor subunit [Bacteroidales bacterium]|nr:efflux RND transporter periplasmic adaptor subunit [Bacteroidales bacterium]